MDGPPHTDFDVRICSGNSARSILPRRCSRSGQGQFQAFCWHSAQQVNPAGNPEAKRTHRRSAVQAYFGFNGQHRDGSSSPGCDTAAAENALPGQPITGHWGLPDPVKATGTDAEKALVFAQTYAALRRRIMTFVELPFESLSRMSLQSRVDSIGTDAHAKA
jgi:hypothetical protein